MKRRRPDNPHKSRQYAPTTSTTLLVATAVLLSTLQAPTRTLTLAQLLLPGVTQQQCWVFLAASDVTRDDYLNKEPEFTRFVSTLTETSYTSYTSLPTSYQTLYDKYAATNPNGQINVQGARPGTTPASPQQTQALTDLCTDAMALATAASPQAVAAAAAVVAAVPAQAITPAVPVTTTTPVVVGATITPAVPAVVPATATPATIPATIFTPAVPATTTPVLPATVTPGTTTTPAVVPATTPAAGPAIAIPFATCRVQLAVSDTSRDNLLTETEYVMFLNRVTSNQRGYTTFAALPPNLQQVFTSLASAATGGQVDIVGASPSTVATATVAQTGALEKLCTDVQAALNAGAAVTSIPAAVTTTTPPLGSVAPGVTPATTVPLPGVVPAVTPATTVPAPGVVPAAPGTFGTVAPGVAPGTTGTSVPATTVPPPATVVTAPAASPAMPFAQCRVSLAIADANRDSQLTQIEYVGFLNRLTRNQYLTASFATLPAPVQTNFNTLAATSPPADTIAIIGAQPVDFATATAEQKAFLEKVCTDTQAITSTTAAGPATTTTPATTTITTSPGTVGATPVPGVTPAPGTGTTTTTTTPPGVTLVPFNQCSARMFIADTNRDSQLTQAEFATFVSRLIPTVSAPTFESLPAGVQAVFTSSAGPLGQVDIFGAVPSQQADAIQMAKLEKICADTQIAAAGGAGSAVPVPVGTTPPGLIGSPLPVPVPVVPGVTVTPIPGALSAPPTYAPVTLVDCGNSMLTVDVNLNKRLEQAEYVEFLKLLTNGQRFLDMTFATLPDMLKTNFQTLSDDGGVSLNVQAADPNASGLASEEQLNKVQNICTSTMAAINNYVLVSSTPPPTAPPKTQTPLPQCKASLTSADVNLDGQLTGAEFVTLVNQMAGGRPLGVGGTVATVFTDLPANLQAIFRTMATAAPGGGSSIKITGANPATPATTEQDAVFQRMCGIIDEEMYEVLYGSLAETQAPVVAPTFPPTPRPTHELQSCRGMMIIADTSPDGYLTPGEYVTFINLLENNAFAGIQYANLHPVLIQNFIDLAAVDVTGGLQVHREDVIDIYGLRPQEALTGGATEAQKQQIANICLETTYAIQDALRPPTIAPTKVPTISPAPTDAPAPTATPTVFDGIVTVYSSFITVTRNAYTAADLIPTNPDRLKLQAAFRNMVQEIVQLNPWSPASVGTAGAAATNVRLRRMSSLRRRFLLVYEEESGVIADIQDRDCPPEVTGILAADCQTIFALYRLNEVVGGTQVEVEKYYEDLTKNAINRGELQGNLTEIGTSALEVYGATAVVLKWEAPPTQAPIAPSNNNDDGEGVNTSVLGVTLVGLLCLFGLGAYFAWNDKDKIKQRWRDFKKKNKETNDEEEGGSQEEMLGGEEDVEYQIGEDGELIVPEELEGLEDGEYEDYEDEFDAESTGKIKKGKRAKKLLGTLGKNVGKIGKHARFDLLNKLDGDLEEVLEIGDEEENLLDFEDYVFDTPAELLTEQNAASNSKLPEDLAGKEGLRESTKGGAGAAAGQSFVAGGFPISMTDSTASSASTVEGSEDEYFEDEFDDEFDSEDDSEEEGDPGSFGLDFSDSGAREGDEDTISSKDDDFGKDGIKDDDSLSSTDEAGMNGNTLVGGDSIEGMLANARLNPDNGDGGEDGDEDKDNGDDDENDSDSEGSSYGSDSTTSSDEKRLEEYRTTVKELVAKVIPEELDNLSTMMDQFEGREAELINTLENMAERTSTQRARAAVHKTKLKVNPNQVGGYSIASEGSAVIAAASTLGPEPQRRQPRVQPRYEEEGSGSYYSDEYSDEGSYSDEEGSYTDDYDEEGYSDEGSYTEEGEDSYYSGEEEGYDDEEGSYYSGEEEEGYDDEQGSYYSGEDEEGYDDEQGSYYSGEDEEGYDDEQGSYYSGEDEEGYKDEQGEEGTYDEQGEEGTYDEEGEYSDEGSRSYVEEGEEEHSGEGDENVEGDDYDDEYGDDEEYSDEYSGSGSYDED